MKRILFSLHLIFTAIAAQAQLTLKECQQLARTHYPEVQRYNLISQTEQYTLSNLTKTWLPQIGLSAQGSWQTAVPTLPETLKGVMNMQGVEVPGMRKDQYKIALDVNQTIWDGGKNKAETAIAQAAANEGRAATEVSLYALEKRVNDLFFSILLLDEHITQLGNTQALLQGNLDKVKSLICGGLAMPSDAEEIEVEILHIDQQMEGMKITKGSFKKMLEIFIGQSLGERKLKRPETIMLNPDASARPEMALFNAQLKKIQAQEASIRTSLMPRLSFFAQGYYGYPGMDIFKTILKDKWSWNAILGIKASWNISGLYTKENRMKQYDLAKQQVQMNKEIFQFNTQLQMAQETGEIARLKKALATDDKIVALRCSVRKTAEQRLQNGVIDTNDLLRKITEELNAKTARSTHEVELLKAMYDLRYTMNQ